MRLTIEIEREIYLTCSLECMLPGLINVGLVVISSSKMKYLPDDNLLYSLFKHDTSTKREDQHCLHKAAKHAQSVSSPGDANPEVPFTIMTVPKLAVNPLCLLWFRDHCDNLIMMGMVWTSGAYSTSRYKHRCRDPLDSWLGFQGWVISSGEGCRPETLEAP